MRLFHSKLTHPHKIYFGSPADTLPYCGSVKGEKTGDFSFSASFILEYKPLVAFYTKQKYYIPARWKNIYKFSNEFTNERLHAEWRL